MYHMFILNISGEWDLLMSHYNLDYIKLLEAHLESSGVVCNYIGW
jgi:hypothetical protein